MRKKFTSAVFSVVEDCLLFASRPTVECLAWRIPVLGARWWCLSMSWLRYRPTRKDVGFARNASLGITGEEEETWRLRWPLAADNRLYIGLFAGEHMEISNSDPFPYPAGSIKQR